MDWVVPLDDSPEASKASADVIDYWLGLYADPLYHGRFPESCIERFGPHKLSFTDEQWALIKGSNDLYVQTSSKLGPILTAVLASTTMALPTPRGA